MAAVKFCRQLQGGRQCPVIASPKIKSHAPRATAPPAYHTQAQSRAVFPETTAMDTGAATAAGGGLDDSDAAFFSRRRRRRCCCFPWPSSSPHARRADEDWWHGVGEGGPGAARRRWWRRGVDALMKVREWSELVAGPRWKTFIRRFRRGGPRHGACPGSGGASSTGRKLNYDPLSYALNFDEGHHGGSPEGDYAGSRDFSARFVAPPGSAKASMDLGGRDAPPLFHHPQPPLPPHSPRTPRAAAAAAAALRG